RITACDRGLAVAAALAQLAQLSPIPLAHVVEMPLHLGALFLDDALLLLKFFRLLCQLCRTGVELARLFIDLRLAALQTRLAVGQRVPHLGELSLPFDELLAEGGDGQTMLFAGAVQARLLLADLLGLELNLRAEALDILLA